VEHLDAERHLWITYVEEVLADLGLDAEIREELLPRLHE